MVSCGFALRVIVLAAMCLGALGCTRERLLAGLYACSEWRTEITDGSWNGLAIGDERRAVLRRLRELEFGEVRGLSARVRVRSSAELDRLDALAGNPRWEIWRDERRPAVIVWFEPDRVTVAGVQVLRQEEGWVDPLRQVRERRELRERLRGLLDAHAVSSVEAIQGVHRAPASEPEESSLTGLAVSARWETGREQWWGHQSLTLHFDGEVLTRITIVRVLFLH